VNTSMYARRPHPKRPTVSATRAGPAYPNTNAARRCARGARPDDDPGSSVLLSNPAVAMSAPGPGRRWGT